MSLLFSVYPLAVFVVMMLGAFLQLFSPEASLNWTYILRLIMFAVQSTILFLAGTVLFVFVYNLFCTLGIGGVCLDLKDK